MALRPLLLAALYGLAAATPSNQSNWRSKRLAGDDSWKTNIKNVVVLVEENRSFDTFCGGLNYSPDINGLLHNNYCNSLNISDSNEAADVCAGPLGWDITSDDPNHSISGVNMQVFGTYHPNETLVNSSPEWKYENMRGFVAEKCVTYKTTNATRAAEVMNYYPPEHIPVFSTMAENFVLFDCWFCAVPGPTNPNRAYITSGTSHGHGMNDADFGLYALPQVSVFQALTEAGISWINYQNSTTGPGLGFNPDAAFYNWTFDTGRYLTNIKPIQEFYIDAAAGNLPKFTYINPECCSYQSFHPPSPINLGETFIKGIYEAHGGFGDHVPPPVGVPPGDDLTYTETAQDGKPITFAFNRLGVRVPTLLISPWVPKRYVEHKGANNGGEYTHTSILSWLSELWGIPKLTPRVEWSSTFEHLFLSKRRSDCESPKKLPDPVVW